MGKEAYEKPMGKEAYEKPTVTPLNLWDLLDQLKAVTSKTKLLLEEAENHRDSLKSKIVALEDAMETIDVNLELARRIVTRIDAVVEHRKGEL